MSSDGEARRPSRLRRSLVIVLVLVVGVVGGYALRALTESTPTPAAPAPAPPTQQAAPAVPAPAPCIVVADRAEELTAQLERAVQAVAALDPATLRKIVDDVERIRDEMQPAVQACRTASAGG